MNLLIDNISIIKEKLLIFRKPGDFYMISILQRKKDFPNETYGVNGSNENCRMIANFYINNMEYFDRKLPLIKDYCHKFNARAYIKPQVRNSFKVNRWILKHMVDQIDNGDLNYNALARVVISGNHTSDHKRFILDLDDYDEASTLYIQKYIQDTLIESGRQNEVENVYHTVTYSGYHIITPGLDPRKLQELNLPKDTYKSDADTILYACKQINN